MFKRRLFLGVALALATVSGAAVAQDKSIVVSSTTSTTDSGLFNHILPLFKQKTGIDVKVVSQGTGQALDTGRRGDSDVVFVHAKPQEEKFVAEGFGVKRFPVMYNDFVLIGPKSDPAGIKGSKDIVAALKTIKGKSSPFISRGDKSGTHSAELALWKAAGIDVAGADKGDWYKEIALRPRHLVELQEPRRSRRCGRGRQQAVQPVRRDPRNPREAQAREEGARPGLHRLARIG
jgi:tungstate transport system substrate-binding protein